MFYFLLRERTNLQLSSNAGCANNPFSQIVRKSKPNVTHFHSDTNLSHFSVKHHSRKRGPRFRASMLVQGRNGAPSNWTQWMNSFCISTLNPTLLIHLYPEPRNHLRNTERGKGEGEGVVREHTTAPENACDIFLTMRRIAGLLLPLTSSQAWRGEKSTETQIKQSLHKLRTSEKEEKTNEPEENEQTKPFFSFSNFLKINQYTRVGRGGKKEHKEREPYSSVCESLF